MIICISRFGACLPEENNLKTDVYKAHQSLLGAGAVHNFRRVYFPYYLGRIVN